MIATNSAVGSLHEMLRDAPMMNDSDSAVHSGFTNSQVQAPSNNCKFAFSKIFSDTFACENARASFLSD